MWSWVDEAHMCTVVLVWSKEWFHDLSAGLSIGLREIWFGSCSNEIEHVDWVVWPMEWMISKSIVGSNRSLGLICFWEASEWVSSCDHSPWPRRFFAATDRTESGLSWRHAELRVIRWRTFASTWVQPRRIWSIRSILIVKEIDVEQNATIH